MRRVCRQGGRSVAGAAQCGKRGWGWGEGGKWLRDCMLVCVQAFRRQSSRERAASAQARRHFAVASPPIRQAPRTAFSAAIVCRRLRTAVSSVGFELERSSGSPLFTVSDPRMRVERITAASSGRPCTVSGSPLHQVAERLAELVVMSL